MSQDQVRTAIDALRARLQEDLDAQLNALSQQQAEAVEVARRTAEAAAEQQWAAKVEAVRGEWSARLESEVAAARADAERRMAAESARLRVEAEQAAAESASRVRAEIEQTLASERQRAAQAASESAATLTEARAAERQAQLAAFERLLDGVRSMDAARTLSEALTALAAAAAAEAPRAALFIVNGEELQGWKARGFAGEGPVPNRVPIGDPGLLGQVFRSGEALTATAGSGRPAPDFAALPPDRAAIAVPIVVGDVAVAVLYADDAGSAAHQTPAAWPESIQILGRHASACVAQLTAIRTAQASRLIDVAGPKRVAGAADDGAAGNSDDDSGARRYARLLVSEIKLYNEGAVRAGREKRDLLYRLRDEIDRARRLYEERIPPAVAARQAYFQQELVQTLAGGDPACLGGQA